MTDKCKVCNGTGFEPGLLTCAFCDSTGIANGIGAAVVEAITLGTGVMRFSAKGVEHVPLKDFLVELKPFRLLPFGTKFRYQGTTDVWVRTQHNVIAEWPCRIWSADGTPRSSLCSFCHLEGDEDGNTLDTLVEVVDQASELAALREELARYKGGCVDLSSQVRELEHKMDYWKGEGKRADDAQQCLTAAEQRNADLVKAMERIQFRCESFHDEALGMRKHSVRTMLDIATKALKPTESGASE